LQDFLAGEHGPNLRTVTEQAKIICHIIQIESHCLVEFANQLIIIFLQE
jgi:hypothetical protein